MVLKTNEMENTSIFNMPTTKTGHCKTSKLRHLDLCHPVLQHEHKLNPFCSGYGKAINNNIDIQFKSFQNAQPLARVPFLQRCSTAKAAIPLLSPMRDSTYISFEGIPLEISLLPRSTSALRQDFTAQSMQLNAYEFKQIELLNFQSHHLSQRDVKHLVWVGCTDNIESLIDKVTGNQVINNLSNQ